MSGRNGQVHDQQSPITKTHGRCQPFVHNVLPVLPCSDQRCIPVGCGVGFHHGLDQAGIGIEDEDPDGRRRREDRAKGGK